MIKKFNSGREFMGALEEGDDLLEQLTEFVQEKEIEAGVLKVIGAVKKAKIGYYDQEQQVYKYKEFPSHLEIASCIGNISLHQGEPMIHAHIVLADEEGNTYSGHLAEGTTVFVSEVYIRELTGNELQRNKDESRGLDLWLESTTTPKS